MPQLNACVEIAYRAWASRIVCIYMGVPTGPGGTNVLRMPVYRVAKVDLAVTAGQPGVSYYGWYG